MIGEEGFLERFWDHVPRFGLAIDGGANIGDWTAALARRFKSVLAFEPDPRSFGKLVIRFAGNDGVSIKPFALGGNQRQVHLIGRSHTSMHVSTEGGGSTPMITIDGLDLDSLGLLKLDLEGYDAWALRGARKTLLRCKPLVIVESIPKFERRYGLNARAPLDYLVSLGAREIDQDRPNHAFAWP